MEFEDAIEKGLSSASRQTDRLVRAGSNIIINVFNFTDVNRDLSNTRK